MTRTTTETVTSEDITRRQIRWLLNEAALAGDSAQVELCELAERERGIDPDSPSSSAAGRAALRECARVINSARASDDYRG